MRRLFLETAGMKSQVSGLQCKASPRIAAYIVGIATNVAWQFDAIGQVASAPGKRRVKHAQIPSRSRSDLVCAGRQDGVSISTPISPQGRWRRDKKGSKGIAR